MWKGQQWCRGEYLEGIRKKQVLHTSSFSWATATYQKSWLALQDKHSHKMLFLAILAILALVSLPTPSASQGDNTALPLTLPPRVISANQQAICPPDEVQETARNDTTKDIRNSIRNTIIPTLCLVGQTQANPAASCSELPTSCSSGYCWVRSSNGTAVQVYCDTQRVCCAGVLWHSEGVWLQQHHRVDTCSRSKYKWPIPAVPRWMDTANLLLRTEEAVWKGQ